MRCETSVGGRMRKGMVVVAEKWAAVGVITRARWLCSADWNPPPRPHSLTHSLSLLAPTRLHLQLRTKSQHSRPRKCRRKVPLTGRRGEKKLLHFQTAPEVASACTPPWRSHFFFGPATAAPHGVARLWLAQSRPASPPVRMSLSFVSKLELHLPAPRDHAAPRLASM
jgi:hypothetical protein